MENASKALIIAGAILATLMVIGLGIVIISRVSGVFDNVGVDQQAAQANNSQYENLMGDNVSSANVKQLITLVRTNNLTAENNQEDMKKIAFIVDGSITAPASVKITTGKRYKVSVPDGYSYEDPLPSDGSVNDTSSGYYKNGYIRLITIEELS